MVDRVQLAGCVYTGVSFACLQVGELPLTGNGAPIDCAEVWMTIQDLQRDSHFNNTRVMDRIKEDKHSAELLKSCQQDAAKHRMTEPRPLQFGDLYKSCYSPRFGVEQGSLIVAVLVLRCCMVWATAVQA